MDFRELNYILAIAKHQNITKAAEALYVSQPTLSKFLISLEKDLGQHLFRKLGHKYVLTYAGELYVKKAEEILRLKTDLDSELADIIKRDVGQLNVSIPQMRGAYMIPGTLPAFRESHPNVQVNVREGSSDEIDARVLSGETDLAFYSKPNSLNPSITYETIMEEELVVCVRKGHPVSRFAQPNPNSKYPRLNPQHLKDELMLRPLPNQRTRQITDEYFSTHGLRYENQMVIGNLPALIQLVSVGYGVTFFFETHVRNLRMSQLVDCYSLGETKTTYDFVVAYRKGSYLPQYARDFIDITKQFFVK